jgi:hypothetical protein
VGGALWPNLAPPADSLGIAACLPAPDLPVTTFIQDWVLDPGQAPSSGSLRSPSPAMTLMVYVNFSGVLAVVDASAEAEGDSGFRVKGTSASGIAARCFLSASPKVSLILSVSARRFSA